MRQPFSGITSRTGTQRLGIPATRLALLATIIGVGCCALAQPPSPAKLPDGEGKEATERICTACHALDIVVTERHDRAAWQKVVDDMVARGADGTDAELKTIVEYLTKYFGPKTSDEN